ncbi:EamA family transporter [Oscillochloris sp. ZM17-4]|uniref:DMT family transporter n=1 Tax=Oscillochloris sp. ZM17-4 TaxID=2866714 RepID=UPI001C735EBD|nr:EamA family transporter [Oscillochloris sp. ZM17-4]MBX0328031.1 EamA family transporter [Oscillochloris sp. ZM17-4]
MQQLRVRVTARPVFAAAAPWIFVLLWSTGFIGARFGLPYIEPFTFLLIRFLIAAGLLAAISLALRAPWPRPAQLGHIAVVGLLLHAGYLGGVFFAIDHGMSAGVSSLIVSLQPILTAVIAQLALREPVAGRQWIGLVLGFAGAGMVLAEKMLAPGAAGTGITGATLAAALIALLSTTSGTLYQKRYGGGMPLTTGTCIQYLAAAVVMLAGSFVFEQRAITWAPQLFFAMGWLVFVLSLGAILLLMTLIRVSSAARVSSLFYLVPPATAFEAYLIFGERFGPLALGGLALASLGVALVVAPTTH